MNVIAIPAFSDNYIWLLHNGKHALVVDPGDATPVIQVLTENKLQLEAILITHHHNDHTGGVNALRPYLTNAGNVWGPAHENIPTPYLPVEKGLNIQLLGLNIQTLDVPGHTLGHVAYYIPQQSLANGQVFEPVLFAGDTLFSAGCGRVFEGTYAQMFASLSKLAQLPLHTKVYPAHEYTLSNLRFAIAVEPENKMVTEYTLLCEKKRRQNIPTLPSTIEQELQINPFLRTKQAQVVKAAQAIDSTAVNEEGVFAVLRQWKDKF